MRLVPEKLASKFLNFMALICVIVIVSGDTLAELYSPQPASWQSPATKIPSDQLDSLVAPIALYPDPLFAQTLAASTTPRDHSAPSVAEK
jgi:hypothetical protein